MELLLGDALTSPTLRLVQGVVIAICLLIMAWYAIRQRSMSGQLFAALMVSVLVYVIFPSVAFYLTHEKGVVSPFWNWQVYPLSQHLLSVACVVIVFPAIKALIKSAGAKLGGTVAEQ